MAKNNRIEHDSMGEVPVPAKALYGAQTQRALDNFPILERPPYRAFIWAMAAVKRGAAEVNCKLGHLETKKAKAIMEAADEVIGGRWHDHFLVDPFQAGAGTSHNMNTNEVIANRANQILGYELEDPKKPVHPNDDVNMAQSTNDTIPTAIRLGCLYRLDELLGELNSLADTLDARAADFKEVIKSGRTHLQDAVPVFLGQEFGAYGTAVRRDTRRIERASKGLRRLGIGGTAVGSGLNADLRFHKEMVKTLSHITGLVLHESDDLFESMQSMADMVDFSASMRTVAVTLGRIANDFRLLTSGPATGLDEIRLPPVQPGSSIMPGKVNPVMAEMLNMACFHVMGNDLTVMLAGQAGQLELNVMMPVIAHNLFEMMQVMIAAIRAFSNRCVKGVEANREKAERWLARNPILVTALNPIIGYDNGAEVAKIAIASGKTIRQVVVEQGYFTKEEADCLLDVVSLTKPGIAKKDE